MLDDYINKIENIISPNHYSRENFKEKLLKDQSKIPKDYGTTPQIYLNEDEDDVEEEGKNPEFIHTGDEFTLQQQPLKEPNSSAKKSNRQLISNPPTNANNLLIVQNDDSDIKNQTSPSRFHQIKTPPSQQSPLNKSAGFNEIQKKKIIKLKEKNQGQFELPENKETHIISAQQFPVGVNPIISDEIGSSDRQIPISKNTKDDETKILLEKIHNLNMKNMNYRYDIEKLKAKVEQLETEKAEQAVTISKLDKQRESLSQYLLRLEALLSKAEQGNTVDTTIQNKTTKKSKTLNVPNSNNNNTNNNNDETMSRISHNNESDLNEQKSTCSMFYAKSINVEISNNNIITITDLSNNKKVTLPTKQDIKKYIHSITKQNSKLKAFYDRVDQMSKTYDSFNTNLKSSIDSLQTILKTSAGTTSIENEQELVNKYQTLVQNVESALKIKQDEYNNLIQAKDDQLEMVNEELLELSSEIEVRKKDRIKDLQIISELEEENKQLKQTLLEKEQETQSTNNKNLLRNLNDLNVGKNKPKAYDKRVEPMKKMMTEIVKKMEANFDLNDKDNVHMIETIHKTLK